MQKELRMPGDCRLTIAVDRNGVRTNTGAGSRVAPCKTFAWAREQTEHSWLGSLEFPE